MRGRCDGTPLGQGGCSPAGVVVTTCVFEHVVVTTCVFEHVVVTTCVFEHVVVTTCVFEHLVFVIRLHGDSIAIEQHVMSSIDTTSSHTHPLPTHHHSLTHARTHSHIYSPHSHTHARTHTRTHSLTHTHLTRHHPLTHWHTPHSAPSSHSLPHTSLTTIPSLTPHSPPLPSLTHSHVIHHHPLTHSLTHSLTTIPSLTRTHHRLPRRHPPWRFVSGDLAKVHGASGEVFAAQTDIHRHLRVGSESKDVAQY